MVWLPIMRKLLKIHLFVLTKSTSRTDGQTDRQHVGCACIASRGKIQGHKERLRMTAACDDTTLTWLVSAPGP